MKYLGSTNEAQADSIQVHVNQCYIKETPGNVFMLINHLHKSENGQMSHYRANEDSLARPNCL